ncbi:Hypothetical protein PBC10988_13380 [Planctomycetales bacterium 10988]|nr:Hypothetical protein PBC10988_13380 [Planctomycetales bacterium 10988]
MESSSDQTVEKGHDHSNLFFVVFLALCLLTLGSFLTYFEFWNTRVPTASSRLFMMAIAVVKASLVILFFMHLHWEVAWKYVLTIPSLLMATILLLGLVPDIGYRMLDYSTERERFAAHPQEAEEIREAAPEAALMREGKLNIEENSDS